MINLIKENSNKLRKIVILLSYKKKQHILALHYHVLIFFQYCILNILKSIKIILKVKKEIILF